MPTDDQLNSLKAMVAEAQRNPSPQAAKQVEDRIEQLGLELKYATALLDQVGSPQYQSSLPVIVWAIVRATPEERCLAALSVMEAKEKHENLDS